MAMANDYYRIYRDQVFRLAETMVIRFDVSAVATNRYLETVGFTVSDDRRTWRYYMNIAGRYHSTNKMMTVRSLDTGEMIEFTPENLEIHRATARGYQYGSSYYKDLLALHPKQEPLILGILNPIDIDVAINAKENTILWMDGTLIEAAEDNLKDLIQADIIGYLERWNVEMYSVVDDLYDAGRLMVLGPQLPNFIFSARLRNEKTHRVHSFFIQQHLARYGRLDKYMDAMTREQQLFLYRNLIHFHKYPGHQDSFEWLVDTIMADRNLPLADHRLLQNDSELVENLDPKIEFLRRELTRQFIGVPDSKVSVEQVTQKQARLALKNLQTEDLNIGDTHTKMQLSKVSNANTKVLESSVTDMDDSYPLKLEDLLISNWFYMAKKGTYLALTNWAELRTGEMIQLSPLDAFIVFLYSYNRAHGYVLDKVPVITANHVLRKPLLSPADIYNKTTKRRFGFATAKKIYDMIPEVGVIVSTESFYDTIHAVWKGALKQMEYASLKGNCFGRGEMEEMALSMFMDIGVDLADSPEQTMDQWLYSRGLEVLADYSRLEYDTVWADLLSRSTGTDLNTTLSLAYIQRAMISIMERLSSYSVHYIREINEEPLKAITHQWVRPGESDGFAQSEGWLRLPAVNEMKGQGFGHSARMTDLPDTQIIDHEGSATGNSFFDIKIEIQSSGETYRQSFVQIPSVGIVPPPILNNLDISGQEFESDVILEPIYPPSTPIALALANKWLSGLNLPVTDRWNLDKNILVTDLSGIIVPQVLSNVSLDIALEVNHLHGFVPGIIGSNLIGSALRNKVLSGLNLPI